MRYSFPVVIRKSGAAVLDSIEVPHLKLIIPIQSSLTKINQVGLATFIKRVILASIADKIKHDEEVEMPALVDNVLMDVLKSDPVGKLGIHDLKLNIDIEYKTNGVFANLLPPLTRLTILAEITAGTILTIGTLQLTEGTILPISPEDYKIISIVQSVLSSILSLWIGLSSAGMAFVGDFGATIDAYLYKLCYRPNRSSLPMPVTHPSEEKWFDCENFGKNAIKSIFFILVINNLLTDAIQDYLQLKLLKDKVSNSATSVFPTWVNSTAAWVEFGFNQLNDPITILSLLIMGFKMIDVWYRSFNQPAEIAVLDDEKNDGGNDEYQQYLAPRDRVAVVTTSPASGQTALTGTAVQGYHTFFNSFQPPRETHASKPTKTAAANNGEHNPNNRHP